MPPHVPVTSTVARWVDWKWHRAPASRDDSYRTPSTPRTPGQIRRCGRSLEREILCTHPPKNDRFGDEVVTVALQSLTTT